MRLSLVLGFIGTLRKCAVYNSIMYLAKYCIYRNIPNTVFDHYCTVKYRILYTNILYRVPVRYSTVLYTCPVKDMNFLIRNQAVPPNTNTRYEVHVHVIVCVPGTTIQFSPARCASNNTCHGGHSKKQHSYVKG